ncbi:MAG: ATP-dependent RecD-like DNA helicase [Clostridiales bacterium]|nr:ATP-dependent RecD-like DNA helicase [Clostridiales bacterium]
MALSGVIEEIVYRNEENGYTVARVERDDSVVTVVGKFIDIQVGANVTLEGKFERTKYGVQYAFTSYEVSMPKSLAGIEKYLGSGLIKGVGPITAKKIVEHFGEQTLDILEYTPQRLSEINGISEKKAIEIGFSFKEHREVQNTIMFLQGFNISTNMALKIYNIYREKTTEIVKNNPYKLVEDVDGIGFLTADKIAQNAGIPVDSVFRVRAGLIYVLKTSCEKNGNTYLPKNMLFEQASTSLELPLEENENVFKEAFDSLCFDRTAVVTWVDNVEIVMLSKYYYYENSIAQKLTWLANCQKEEEFDLDEQIANFEQRNHITFHEEQKNAIVGAINNGVFVITGGPGTGKTTIIKCILEILTSQQKTVSLVAPTGRAAKRMSDSTGKEAKTIHRLLEVNVIQSNESFFVHNESNPLKTDAVIVDEVSMVDAALMCSLLKAMPRDCRLILVGDKDQLPSVGAGNVLSDILTSETIKYCMLTKIFRQEEKSLIITNAHLINEGKMPLIDNTSLDFFFESKNDPEIIKNTILDLVSSRLPKFLNIEPQQIQVLAPLKAGVCGIENLNKVLQQSINPPSEKRRQVEFGQTIFREGDKVMQMSNNYDLEWKKHGLFADETGKGVFNGDIGYVQTIDPQTSEVVVEFEDGRICLYTRPDLVDLSLSYAITIHKSQGSEFDTIIIPAIAGPSIILTRNLIYTAVTRAKKMVVIVGEKQYLKRMVSNKYTATRFTLLRRLLILANEKISKMF